MNEINNKPLEIISAEVATFGTYLNPKAMSLRVFSNQIISQVKLNTPLFLIIACIETILAVLSGEQILSFTGGCYERK
jgi:hypothetical protein